MDIFSFLGGGTLAVLFVIVIIVLIGAYATGRIKVAGANEALVRTGGFFGQRSAELKVVRAGRVVVLPLIHKLGRIHLSARQINVNLADAVTKQGIKVAVQGVATVKIGGDEESIRNAAERFLDREDLLDSIVKNVLEGSLRSIVGTLTVEELNYDRQKFQQEVQSAAKGDLATSGLMIDNFTIQAIRDEVGYMDLIGQQETARRERDARMAKAQADQEAAVREAEAQQIKLNAQRDVSLRQAEIESQTAAAKARADQSGPLAQAEATQEVVRKQTELAELEADRRAKELLASTVRPAEADADAVVKRAEGEKQARIRQAEAAAESTKLAGQAEATVTVTKGEAAARIVSVTADAEAHKTQVEGSAEAAIVFTKGEAEAKALALRAEAYRQFNQAAVIQTVLSMLPDIVRAAAEPMANIDNLTVLSSEGASDVVKNATRTVTEASTAVKGLTGIDIPSLLANALGSARPGEEGPEPPRTPPAAGGRGRPRSPRTQPRPAPAVSASGRELSPDEAFARAGVEISRARERFRESLGTAAALPLEPMPASAAAAAEGTTSGPGTPPEKSATTPARTNGGTEPPGVPTIPPGSAPTTEPSTAPLVDLGITTETTVDQAAARLADELRAIPGIGRLATRRLAELDRVGPGPLRAIWKRTKPELDERIGALTIGELLERYAGRRPH